MTTNRKKFLIVAYAGIGHINPGLRFANRILKMGVEVTFCTSLSVVKRIDKEAVPHGLTFAPFSDGHDNGRQPTTSQHQYISDFETKGPLIPLEFLDENEDSSKSSLGMDFFDIPTDDYIQWLNTKEKSTVVYVSFGTIATFSLEQLEEIAIGLLEIGRPFLWVIRDDEKTKRLSKIEDLEKLGMIVSWCSQVVVLSHQAIGCYVMHGGWNSTTESLVAAIPTVVFPQWSDQPNDAKMLQDVWKTGLKVKTKEGDGMLEGKELKRCVQMVMGNKEMKRNADRWSALAKEALSDGGSSAINLQAFLENV